MPSRSTPGCGAPRWTGGTSSRPICPGSVGARWPTAACSRWSWPPAVPGGAGRGRLRSCRRLRSVDGRVRGLRALAPGARAVAGLILANTRAGADTPKAPRPSDAGRAAQGRGERPRGEPPSAPLRGSPRRALGRREGLDPRPAAGGHRSGGARDGGASGLDARPRDDRRPDLGDHVGRRPPDPAGRDRADGGSDPRRQLAVLAGVGHLSNLEDPTGFSRSLATHLERSGVVP